MSAFLSFRVQASPGGALLMSGVREESTMEVLFPRCAGLDVHRDTVAAAVRVQKGSGKATTEVRAFATTGGQLGLLADWLAQNGVTLVGMESTGVYWKPVFYMLEDRFECWGAVKSPVYGVPCRWVSIRNLDHFSLCDLVLGAARWWGRPRLPLSPVLRGRRGSGVKARGAREGPRSRQRRGSGLEAGGTAPYRARRT